jgi:hypothetical protein
MKKHFDFKSPHTGFLKPQIGFFGNTGDYYGAVSPSGVLREKYHQLRKANLFFNSFEPIIAASGQARRSIYRPKKDLISSAFDFMTGRAQKYPGMDTSVVVKDKRIGVCSFNQ